MFKIKIISIFYCVLFVANVYAQERFTVTLDSTKDTKCTSPVSYSPKSVFLTAGYWNVKAKSGAWQPWGVDVDLYLHSFVIGVDNRLYAVGSQIRDSAAGAFNSSSSNDGRVIFRLNQDQMVDAYISDSLCTDNAGSEAIEFIKIPSFKDNCNGIGNPCQVSTGVKLHSEMDFSGRLNLIRSYTTSYQSDVGFGVGWRGHYQKRIIVKNSFLVLIQENSIGQSFQKVNGFWESDSDSDIIVTDDVAGFKLTTSNGETEYYSSSGYLLTKVDNNGNQINYNYNVNQQVSSISNSFGDSVSFTYIQNKIVSVTDSLGSIYRYAYDDKDNLISVVYPDGTPLDDTDNPRKTYLYQNTEYPNHLTGIIDENGDRYATYTYDSQGKAISTEHAQTTNPVGQEKFELDYQGAN